MLSAPSCLTKSVRTAVEPLPLNGRIKIIGSSAGGNRTQFRNGFRRSCKRVNAPESRNTAMATSIPTRYGMIFTAIEKPSFAPSTNSEYTATLRPAAYSGKKVKRNGIASGESALKNKAMAGSNPGGASPRNQYGNALGKKRTRKNGESTAKTQGHKGAIGGAASWTEWDTG